MEAIGAVNQAASSPIVPSAVITMVPAAVTTTQPLRKPLLPAAAQKRLQASHRLLRRYFSSCGNYFHYHGHPNNCDFPPEGFGLVCSCSKYSEYLKRFWPWQLQMLVRCSRCSARILFRLIHNSPQSGQGETPPRNMTDGIHGWLPV